MKQPETIREQHVEIKSLNITSAAFRHNEMIPQKYTCEGADVSPPLEISGVPQSAKSLAIIVDDPDAPRGTWVHWVVWNIPITTIINEDEVPGRQGRNDFGNNTYGGPCPPSGTHRYFFKVYALDVLLELSEGSSKSDVEQAMKNNIVAQGELIGLYSKSK